MALFVPNEANYGNDYEDQAPKRPQTANILQIIGNDLKRKVTK